MNSEPTLIKLQGIQKSFLTDELETRALDGLCLQIRSGEFLAVSGPSACGKPSLILADKPTGKLDSRNADRLAPANPQPARQTAELR